MRENWRLRNREQLYLAYSDFSILHAESRHTNKRCSHSLRLCTCHTTPDAEESSRLHQSSKQSSHAPIKPNPALPVVHTFISRQYTLYRTSQQTLMVARNSDHRSQHNSSGCSAGSADMIAHGEGCSTIHTSCSPPYLQCVRSHHTPFFCKIAIDGRKMVPCFAVALNHNSRTGLAPSPRSR